MTRLPLQAVLFDMDGTLVDTERLWWEAVEQVAGRPLTEADRPQVLGRPVEYTAAWLAAATDTPAAALAAALHQEFADRVRTGVVPRPGALDLLDALAHEGVPTALVTASPGPSPTPSSKPWAARAASPSPSPPTTPSTPSRPRTPT